MSNEEKVLCYVHSRIFLMNILGDTIFFTSVEKMFYIFGCKVNVVTFSYIYIYIYIWAIYNYVDTSTL